VTWGGERGKIRLSVYKLGPPQVSKDFLLITLSLDLSPAHILSLSLYFLSLSLYLSNARTPVAGGFERDLKKKTNTYEKRNVKKTYVFEFGEYVCLRVCMYACTTLQYNTIHCNTLQHTVTLYNTL